jgi:O-acetyl-ADP-ribose deacetylase (regulator of RNase III)
MFWVLGSINIDYNNAMQKNKIKVHQGDIAKLEVDCIVNAANSQLNGGSGVCGAIFDAAGWQEMAEACSAIGGCETGEAVITPGFNLPAKYVVHAVGPIYDESPVIPELLKSAYLQSLWLAEQSGSSSIAFPLISAGIYGYPKEEAIDLALEAISIYQQESDSPLSEIVICAYSDEDYDLLANRAHIFYTT